MILLSFIGLLPPNSYAFMAALFSKVPVKLTSN